ncbi:hypothetical protein MNEG_7249 [Monoraphidium neglectum]|uniref:Uncharacterized protein n=1 Tax=Monoraphidium neglectum TaxID=145388 RepID=A0A0D2JNJ4_9CHLO|nr:hypothetical protein MNEG_7249 [Monoraphidium neglectum]KIZ00713.1 hypothetical protein MNEG_7249 [Monoraphidium neglectum]|eukprot:XP_013899732.1 hypothetical protein MNEG_7249 [Monoraphidium neglectum]
MPQKPLLKANKKLEKKQAANRHGKTPKTKKGSLAIKPKRAALQGDYKDQQELSKMINKKNESNFAAKAEQAGGQMKMVKAPPPVLAPADAKKRAKEAKETKRAGAAAMQD